MKPYLRPATALFIGIFLVLLIGGRSRFFRDPGTFWHTKVGDKIIEDGFFDKDPFSFTFADREWIPHQWLGECTMSVLYRIGGFDTQLLAACLILASVFTGLGMRLMRAGFHPSIVAVITAAGIAASSGHFHVRPHLATIAGMAIVMVYLVDLENGRIAIRRLLWLVPVIWLWSNFHGGVVGGLASIAFAIGGWTFARLIKRDSPIKTRRDFLTLVGIWLLCVAVCFANPYFHRLPKSWFDIYQMKSLTTIIEEHAPVNTNDFGGLTIVIFGALFILTLLTVPLRKFRVVWLLPLIWFALACMRVRHAPLFTMAALVMLADLFPFTRIADRLVRSKSELYLPQAANDEAETTKQNAEAFVLPAAVVVLALFLQMFGAPVPVLGRGWAQHDSRTWPTALLPELAARQFDRPKGTRIFSEYNFGGFLIHQTPSFRVFIDDRCELYGDEFLVNYVHTREQLALGLFEDPAEPFAEWQAEYGSFDYALVATDRAFDKALARIPAWEEVKRTPTAVLYKKRSQ